MEREKRLDFTFAGSLTFLYSWQRVAENQGERGERKHAGGQGGKFSFHWRKGQKAGQKKGEQFTPLPLRLNGESRLKGRTDSSSNDPRASGVQRTK